ncbi:DUF418 domain-containing protein [Paenibacillus filicis]|uniref:DUF418 domain-containing protein n=1 Tax=Paenibacillus filicis TaxID=669464 RepID=A0ABU9DFJ1_9BACL
MHEMRRRVGMIDALRGWSLLGILLANMLIFQYGIWGKDQIRLYELSTFDLIWRGILNVTVEHSFMPVFSFLFGYSMVKLKESLEAQGLKAGRHLFRRSILLLTLGWLHAEWLWEGDVLGYYGLMSFFLLLFLGRKAKTLLVWGVLLLSLFGLMALLPSDSGPGSGLFEDKARMEAYVKETIPIYAGGTYEEIRHHSNTASPLDENNFLIAAVLIFAPFMTAPLFLLGMYGAKKQWFQQPDQERSRYRRRMLLFLPVGLMLKSLGYLGLGESWSESGEMLGGNLLALGYIFAFAWICALTKPSSVWLARLEATGRLSLTNYLMQSVIGTTLFYGYGFGWFGRLGVLAGCAIALVIYAVQLYCSAWYLRRFGMGPVERLLRMGTYLTVSARSKPKNTTLSS